MYSSSIMLFVQGLLTIVLLFHCNSVSYYLLKWALMIFEENMLVRENIFYI